MTLSDFHFILFVDGARTLLKIHSYVKNVTVTAILINVILMKRYEVIKIEN